MTSFDRQKITFIISIPLQKWLEDGINNAKPEFGNSLARSIATLETKTENNFPLVMKFMHATAFSPSAKGELISRLWKAEERWPQSQKKEFEMAVYNNYSEFKITGDGTYLDVHFLSNQLSFLRTHSPGGLMNAEQEHVKNDIKAKLIYIRDHTQGGTRFDAERFLYGL